MTRLPSLPKNKSKGEKKQLEKYVVRFQTIFRTHWLTYTGDTPLLLEGGPILVSGGACHGLHTVVSSDDTKRSMAEAQL